ncbi:MAG TPA: glycerol-3-phosphate dehydrogenase/oxidase [Ohtaekwangia sp.]|nr:glycerol-3-phosphate dehydrogenase/oxidase [Ohtaekwangia sp.]
MTGFSFFERNKIQRNLQEQAYDLVIVGGGITGAGIALDAASRGLKTALLEKNDFAFGTSSRSTKLIHGGLRYLKQLEFGLVKEVGSERAVVHKLAPHLVVPEKMLLPLSDKKGLGYWVTSIGLKIYDWLAGVRPEDQRRMLTRAQTLRREPLLRKDEVKGGAIYAEYRTDDARLTVEIMKAAERHGADVLNYASVSEFIYAEDKVSGVCWRDELGGQEYTVRAKAVVNATGPWVDELRTLNNSRQGKRLHLTKGVHIVVPFEKLPVRQAIYFDTDDGRMIFAIPRGRTTYIGTTDTNYDGDKDNVFTTREDAAYLVHAVNTTFPKAALSLNDIESSWAGLRPLIHEEGKSASGLSRKDEIFESATGLISIAGGKLTGYRKMAERVVNLLVRTHFRDRDLKPCHTTRIMLGGDAFSGKREVRRYLQKIKRRLPPAFPPLTARYLVENYGKQTGEILQRFEAKASPLKNEIDLLKAELWFSVHHEMICKLEDFFIRRTGMLYFNIAAVNLSKAVVAEEMRDYFGWDENRMLLELESLDRQVRNVTAFKA